MDRYRSYRDGGKDDRSTTTGDTNLIGVNQYDSVEDIPPGQVQDAVNMDFTKKSAETRGGFVCIPELGTQPFGQEWTTRTAPTGTAGPYNAVCYANGVWVTVGSGFGATDIVATSIDSITWTARNATHDGAWSGLCYGNSLFVAVSNGVSVFGVDDYIMTSPDGATWTARNQKTTALDAVVYGNGIFVAVGSTNTCTSTNGTAWTVHAGAAILGIDNVTITTAGTIVGEQKVIAREAG